jgi:hypothetical protein
MGFIADQIGFDALSKLPFPGEPPLKLAFASRTPPRGGFPQLKFERMPSPPSLIQGVSFGFDLVAPDGGCNALCEILMDKIPGLTRLKASVALGRVNGKVVVKLVGEIDFDLDVGPVALKELALNLDVPIPSIAKTQIYLSAVTKITLSPGYEVGLIAKIGYKPKSLFLSIFFDGYIENFFMIPFFTAGNAFIEAEINQSPTVAVGIDVIVGKDCITPRGQFDTSRGCLFARGAVGIGLDLFFIVDFPYVVVWLDFFCVILCDFV